MLPEGRISGGHSPLPKFTVEKRAVQGFMEELRGFPEEFVPKLGLGTPMSHSS